jgi:hypothetical protein
MKTKLITFCFFLMIITDIHSAFSDDWKRIYLATYPRSGNHWARYLIEEVTHIATSSAYCDPDPQHIRKPFPWGGYCCNHGYEGTCRYPTKDDYVVIKTHYPGQNIGSEFHTNNYVQALRIVRNPVDAFYSQYERLSKGKPEPIVPRKIVMRYIKTWERFQNYWNNKRDVITVRYENMLKDPENELRTIISAIKYKASDEDIIRAVQKYPPQGYELKHRDKFAEKDIKLMRRRLKEYLKQFNYEI